MLVIFIFLNKDSTIVRNQRPSSDDRDRNVYFAFLPMRQRQGTILAMLGYHARSRTCVRKKTEQDRTHSFSWNSLTGSNQHRVGSDSPHRQLANLK